MTVFDGYIRNVHSYEDELRKKGIAAKEFFAAGAPESLCKDLPIRVGPEANSSIILRSNTFLELGSPDAGSCSQLLWTQNENLVRDGRIGLVGPDIPESGSASLPFGQILLVAGKALSPDHHDKLHQAQLVGDHVEGYMVRSSSEQLWSRVSKESAKKGFCFETLGRALISMIKTQVSEVTAVEVLFVTSSKQHVKQLQNITLQVKELSSEILKEAWKARGFELDCNFDCASCHDEEVCDDIRDVISATQEKRDASKLDVIKNS